MRSGCRNKYGSIKGCLLPIRNNYLITQLYIFVENYDSEDSGRYLLQEFQLRTKN